MCFFDTDIDYQVLLFRAQLPNMVSMQPFQYTTESAYYSNHSYELLDTDPYKNDQYRNCSEWQVQCTGVNIEDIYKTQYETSPVDFLSSCSRNELEKDFPNNTFVRFLSKSANKEVLSYVILAKEVEGTEFGDGGRFEQWDRLAGESYSDNGDKENKAEDVDTRKRRLMWKASSALDKASTQFLRERYAFQLCRLQYQQGFYEEAIATYDKYFMTVDSNKLMSVWAGLFKAMSMDKFDKQEANRWYARVFAAGNEKKVRCVQLFNLTADLPKNCTPKERSIITSIITLRNPGRALAQMKQIYAGYKENEYLPFLVVREINKLEDWLISPQRNFQSANRSIAITALDYYFYNEQKKEEQQYKANRKRDIQYLRTLKTFLIILHSEAKGETKDFYAVALAHLSLLDEDPASARIYQASVSANANPTIQLQKKLGETWIAIKTEDISSAAFQTKFVDNIKVIERISVPMYRNMPMLRTFTVYLADAYLKKGDRVTGNLMQMRSDNYTGNPYEEPWFRGNDDNQYSQLSYFDENANINDLDRLIALLLKKKKTPFEQYLCNQPLNSIDAYKNLKGTIAFRNNNLELAYSTFSSIPTSYWEDKVFKSYLNEDPFVPKGIGNPKDRRFDYEFNKAKFVKRLIELKQNAANDSIGAYQRVESLILLGNAYFNTSYWGNAWMMTSYGRQTEYSDGKVFYLLPQWGRDYRKASMATQYYNKALAAKPSDDQKAYISFMLYYLNRKMYDNWGTAYYGQTSKKFAQAFNHYTQTSTYSKYTCPGIDLFLK